VDTPWRAFLRTLWGAKTQLDEVPRVFWRLGFLHPGVSARALMLSVVGVRPVETADVSV
jgi:hypothetical protein